MGLNLSNRHIATGLEMSETQIHGMTTTLRTGIVAQELQVELSGTVACDEVHVAAGRQGHPESVKKRAKRPKTPTERLAWP